MDRPGASVLVLLAALISGVTVPPCAAQTARPAGANARPAEARGPARPADPSTSLEFDLDRIREGLSRTGNLNWKLPEGVPVFRVGIQEKLPGIEAILGDVKALQRGPFVSSPYHQEFLDLVTPPEARASFTNSELLQVLATGLAGQLALQGITRAIRNAIAGGRSREACEAVRTSLLDLNVDRVNAGLDPVYVPECP